MSRLETQSACTAGIPIKGGGDDATPSKSDGVLGQRSVAIAVVAGVGEGYPTLWLCLASWQPICQALAGHLRGACRGVNRPSMPLHLHWVKVARSQEPLQKWCN